MSRWKRLSFGIIATLGSFLSAGTEIAIVSRPRFDDLLAAINSSSRIRLQCDGKIVFAFPINVSKTLTIDASGHDITFDGRGLCQFFILKETGDLTLNSLTLTNGLGVAMGGAIMVNGGALTLENCKFTGNRARGTPRTLYFVQPQGVDDDGRRYTPAGPSFGGALWASSARLTLRNSLFENNFAMGNDGNSSPFSAGGGAIDATLSTVIISGCTFRSNRSNAGGMVDFDWPSDSKGGALHANNSNVQISSSVFLQNSTHPFSAGKGGGAVNVESGSLSINKSSFISNSVAAGSAGGALHLNGPASISQCVFAFNSGTNAGGGAISHVAPLEIVQSAFVSNRVRGVDSYYFSAGGYGSVFEATRAYGGAIQSQGRLEATNCVFFGNVSRSGDGYPYPSAGGSSVLSKPSAGSALYVARDSTARFVHCTFAANTIEIAARPDTTVPIIGSAIWIADGSPTRIGSLELQACLLSGLEPLVKGFATDSGFNISSDMTPEFSLSTSLNNTDALLQYFPDKLFSIVRPLPTSPAIGRVTTLLSDYDIRGASRSPLPDDSGAVELNASTTLSISSAPTSITLSAPSYNDSIQILGSDDLKTWVQIGFAHHTQNDPLPILTIAPSDTKRFYKARLDQ